MSYRGITRRNYFNGERGCVERRRNRRVGADVALYHAGQAGYPLDYSRPWVTVCFTHGVSATHPSLREAREMLALSDYWCQECRKVLQARLAEKLAKRGPEKPPENMPGNMTSRG